nr:TadE family protein [uncultured Sphingomonas sp.]
MIRAIKQICAEKRGVATIELALVAPVLAVMVIGVSDISNAYGRKLQLEQAAQRAMERVAQTTGENTPADTIKNEAVCQFNGLNPDNTCQTAPLTVDDVVVTYSLKCNGVVTDYSTDCASGQTEVRYISTTVTYNYAPMFAMKIGAHSDGMYHLVATAGVRVV